jgi:CRISPR system Cascade subunit CasE
MVWDLYTDHENQKRDFLYRIDTVRGRPVIYSVSQRRPVYLGNIWSVETKEYNPVIYDGQSLWFALRANPVRTRWTLPDGEGKRHHKRHDVVMDAKRALRSGEGSQASGIRMAELVQAEGVRWIREKGEKFGFTVDERHVIAGGYRQHRFLQGSKNRQVSLSTIDFSGLLTVTDAQRFRYALMNGIGPAKGFGCGMMMIKPA